MRKRSLLSIVLVFVLLFLCVCPANGAGLPGDVDSSGKITAADARHALRIAVGLEREKTPGSVAYVTADANCNDSVDPEDARLILRAAINLEKLEDYVK